MFNSHMIGNYISFLRKRNKMTQSQLAEKVGVSHQAVSNWERGEAMPDISLLQTLAAILFTTVDKILASGEACEDEPSNITADDSQVINEGDKSNIADNCDSDDKSSNSEYERVFIPNNSGGYSEAYVLKSGISKTNDSEQPQPPPIADVPCKNFIQNIDFERVIKLAPFASEETLDKIVRAFIMGSGDENKPEINMKEINRLAPFLSEESLDLLVMHFSVKADWNGVLSLAPHLSEKALDSLIEGIDLKIDFKMIKSLAPHLSEKALDSLVEGIDLKVDFDMIKSLAPHLSEESLNKLVNQLDETDDYNKIIALAPFLSEEILDKLIISGLSVSANGMFN